MPHATTYDTFVIPSLLYLAAACLAVCKNTNIVSIKRRLYELRDLFVTILLCAVRRENFVKGKWVCLCGCATKCAGYLFRKLKLFSVFAVKSHLSQVLFWFYCLCISYMSLKYIESDHEDLPSGGRTRQNTRILPLSSWIVLCSRLRVFSACSSPVSMSFVSLRMAASSASRLSIFCCDSDKRLSPCCCLLVSIYHSPSWNF